MYKTSKMILFVLIFAFSVQSIVVRVPIHESHDREDVLGMYGLDAKRFIQDDQGSAYLAVVNDLSECPSCQTYKEEIDWGDESCVEVETLSPIERIGFWHRRATSPYSAEIWNVFPDSEARERVLRLENKISVRPCSIRETHRYKYPIDIMQTYTNVQLQSWASHNELTGRNLTAVLIDTGIRYSHLQFGQDSDIPFAKVLGTSFNKEKSNNSRISGIFVRKHWVGDWDMPDDYAIYCGIKDLSSHGTHTAGILAGNHGSVGLAGESNIIMVNNAVLNSNPNDTKCNITGHLSGMSYYDLQSIMDAGYDPVVFSNSWGAGTISTYFYIAENAEFDQFLYENPSTVMLFAAGNGGQNSFSIQALSRNILSVGATDDRNKMADFSAAGPTIARNGRMTVHIVTNGVIVLSAGFHSDTAHVYKSGTSMSTPLASAIATLLREWLIREEHPNARSGSLLRTIMIHCAVPLPKIDRTAQGFGFLQPALLTDYGQSLEMEDYLVSNTTPIVSVRSHTATRNEIFRISFGWYSTSGYSLENQAASWCIRNSEDLFNHTDPLNTLGQITIHLLEGDHVDCWIRMVRAHNKTEGFIVSVASGSWPNSLIYIPEDTNATKVEDELVSFLSRTTTHDLPIKGIPLVKKAWLGRRGLQEIMKMEWYYYMLYAGLFVCVALYVFILTYCYNSVSYKLKNK